jgi:enoyl-CoA hydratase
MIDYETVGRVGVITLDRPAVRNAQNDAFLRALDQAWERVARDPQIRVGVLKANGPHFSAGHDLKDYDRDAYGSDRPRDLARAYQWEAERFLGYARRWSELPKPTIAAVQGACVGAGLMLCWPCDLIIASEDARFSDPVGRLGIGGVEYHAHTWELGPRKAKELLFTAGWLSAEDAREAGMVNRVVPAERLVDESMGLATEIAEMDPFGLAQAKRAVNVTLDIMGRYASLQAAFDVHWTGHGRALGLTQGEDSLLAGLDELRSGNR